MHTMRQANAESLLSPESFWTHHASALHWHRPPSSALARYPKTVHTGADTDRDTDTNGNQAHYNAWTWFPDGEISTTYNCVDRHVEAGLGDRAAIIWDSPVTGAKETWTYARLLDEVEVLAGVLREEGVARGDVVIIYMPMIPQALVAALAITRLGAIHAAVFGGFAASSLAQRIDAARPKAIVTASCGIEGSKGAIPYRPLVEGAIKASVFKPSKTLIYQRDAHRWNQPDKRNGQRNWQRLVKSARMRGIRARSPVAVRSDEGLYVIYTSGTTGLPKGVVREAGGHAVGLALSIKQLFGVRGPGDVMFCASDIGWVVGHSYILYAPLLVGATTVLFEGKPVGTPDAGTFWRIIEEHRVNVLFTAPTAMRAIRKEDPANRFFKAVAARGGLRQLRALFLAGERSEPSIVETFQALLSQHAAPGARVVDNWWSSESGSPITGLALGLESESESESESPSPTTIRPGSAGLPTPGFDVRIVNDSGTPLPHGTMGNIVLGLPLGPTAFTRLFHDAGDARFYKSYLQRFDGRWLDTGDAGVIDHDGFVHVMARSDDIINVAAHRFSTGAIEQVILAHPRVAEAVVVGVPDALKGVLPFAFVHVHVHVSQGSSQGPPGGGGGGGGGGDIPVTDAKLFSEVNALVREQIGAIASLGGMIQGRGMIPKTRSGKTLRRVLRELVELAARGDLGETTTVNVPPTVEDGEVVGVARGRVREFFTSGSGSGSGAGAKAKL